MQNHPGTFIVLEGSDGSGKSTQFRLLTERLKAVGHDVEVFKFPQYNEPSGHFVRRYLAGEYGPADSISPYTASLFYALDRYEATPKIKAALQEGKIVLADRYTGANMAHQGAKLNSMAEQRGFFMWADSTEYQLLAIPRPTINLFLKVLPEISKQLIAQRADKTSVALDEHEKNIEHLNKAVAAYDLLCQLFPRDFKEIDCMEDGKMRGIIEINDLIWETIKPLLPEPKRKGRNVVLNLDQSSELSSSRDALRPSGPDPKPVIKTKQSKNESAGRLESILNLQKQMIAKAGSLKAVNQRQLKEVIGLITPLAYRKSELKELLEEINALKTSPDDEPVSVNEIIEQLAGRVPIPANSEPIKLLAANPRNEFQLLDKTRGTNMNYRQKEQALVRELKIAASNASYDFEATSNWATLLAFKNEVDAKKIKISAVGARLGYGVPEIIEDANLEESFNKAFEISGELYDQMDSNGDKDGVYDLLLGHNVCWRFKVDAGSLSKALKSSQNRELLSFLDLLREKVAETHPHVARTLLTNEPKIQKAHKRRR